MCLALALLEIMTWLKFFYSMTRDYHQRSVAMKTMNNNFQSRSIEVERSSVERCLFQINRISDKFPLSAIRWNKLIYQVSVPIIRRKQQHKTLQLYISKTHLCWQKWHRPKLKVVIGKTNGLHSIFSKYDSSPIQKATGYKNENSGERKFSLSYY